MTSDEERREVAKRLRNGGIARDPEEAYVLLLSCVGIRPQLPATSTYEDAMVRIADLIDRPTCRDLVEHKPDPFVPGKQMTDGFFHCSGCGWHGRIYEYIGFGDMTACEAVYCPKCGTEVPNDAV